MKNLRECGLGASTSKYLVGIKNGKVNGGGGPDFLILGYCGNSST